MRQTGRENGFRAIGGLTQRLMSAAYQWQLDLDELTSRLQTVEADLPDFERRASSPAGPYGEERAFRHLSSMADVGEQAR